MAKAVINYRTLALRQRNQTGVLDFEGMQTTQNGPGINTPTMLRLLADYNVYCQGSDAGLGSKEMF